MRKVAITAAAVALLAACSETPTGPRGTDSFAVNAANLSLISATNSAPNEVTVTFAEVSNVKSYNVKLNPGGGVKHVAAKDLVAGIGTAVFTNVPPGSYSVCLKLQAQSTQFSDECLTVTVAGTAVTLLPQTIVMDPIEDRTYGDEPFAVSATGGDSGNPVIFTASGDCTVDEDVVTILAAGSCTVTADQEGGNGYAAAASVSRSFTIAPKALTITVSPTAASRTFGQANPSCSYTVNGVVGTENFSVSCA